MAKIAKGVADLIGNTPLFELVNYNKRHETKGVIIAKLESFNPMSSVKDRVGFALVRDGMNKGLINNDTVIIEPTSGNTGIGLASMCASMNLRLILTMSETMSLERRALLKALGAELVLTEGKKGVTGAIEKAEELNAEIPNSIILGQFVNPANPQIHRETTAVEILRDTDGEVDVFVAGVGTGGTITGVGEVLKQHNSQVKIVAVEPADSPMISQHKAGPHKIQGIGAGFIPKILNVGILDEVITVTNEDAMETTRNLARTEGILCGISSGAALYAATEIAKREAMVGKRIVVLLPDTGERYLSSEVFN